MTSSGAPPAAEGLSGFAARVLNQLSITAWLPAVTLVGNGAVLASLRSAKSTTLSEAVTSLTHSSFGITVALVLGVIVASVVTQSVEFAAIRCLEGHWGVSGFAYLLSKWRIGAQLRRKRRLALRAIRTESTALTGALRRVERDFGLDRSLLGAIEAIGRGETPQGYLDSVVEEAKEWAWRDYAPVATLHRLAALNQQVASYPPERRRTMPTRLGNTLRGAEDRLQNTEGDLRGFVIRNLDRIPRLLLEEHDHYRNRLDMYCVMVPVCLTLAIATPLILVHHNNTVAVVATPLYGVAAVVAYIAAVGSAQRYARVLRAIDDRLGALPSREDRA